MLKRIDKSQVRVGMFVESVEGIWLNSPLANRRFMLEHETDAETLKVSNLSGVFINTAKGLDVLSAPASDRSRPSRPSAASTYRRRYERVFAARTIMESTGKLKEIFGSLEAGAPVVLDLISPIVDQITRSIEISPDILISMTRMRVRDETTFLHSLSVSALMVRFAQYKKLDDATVQMMGMAGLLHDIGKTGMPLEITMKAGALTDREMALMRTHPAAGHALLSRTPDMPDLVLDICLNHHERLDGRGYPSGLSGDEISLYTRMASICDVYDAVTAARPYKKAWTHAEASAWMLDTKGCFDRVLLREFFSGVACGG